jgi:hypothetical protein
MSNTVEEAKGSADLTEILDLPSRLHAADPGWRTSGSSPRGVAPGRRFVESAGCVPYRRYRVDERPLGGNR